MINENTYIKYCSVIDEWLSNGRNGTKAYQKIYPNATCNTADKSFRVIHGIPRIKEYIDKKLSNKSEELDITLLSQLKLLSDIIDQADKISDKINAIKEQNKLLALYREHNQQKNPETKKDYSKLTNEEIKLLAEIESKALQ